MESISEFIVNATIETEVKPLVEYINNIKKPYRAQVINELIKRLNISNDISDGYHTFKELYDHRIELFIAYCKTEEILHLGIQQNNPVWMSDKDSNGNFDKNWFILGIHENKGEQITYHLPIERWEECKKFAVIKEYAPVWDGHTSADVLQRLKNI